MSEVRLIDAEGLRERLLVLRNNITNVQCISDIFDICLTEVSNAPTVNTVSIEKQYFIKGFKEGCEYGKKCYERPHGEWIVKVERRGFYAGDKTVYSYTCPFCGKKEFDAYEFCRCGADMRKGGAE